MNPYEAPKTNSDVHRTTTASHPARPLLYLVGLYCLPGAIPPVPVGLAFGQHVPGMAFAMFIFGATAIWLGYRRYDDFARTATIGWGAGATFALLTGIAMEPPRLQDSEAIVRPTLALLIVVAIPLLAWQCQPGEDSYNSVDKIT